MTRAKTGKFQMKRLSMLTILATVLCASTANAQYDSRPACVMFEHANFRGRALEMSSDDAVNFRNGQFWNDRVSSVMVRRGCTLVAYEDSDMGGRSITITRRVRNLDDGGWNDRISSAECYCDAY
ncbi:peptidase inhibitor family I36 protein [Mesorhizobium shangrilense]|uniref:Peptidase inhibitor family I36 protein n=1 Tax=Mesorhizobium shangrilense TaxID=460060 RepID=A0ABV2D8D7_9HYPH